MPRSGLLGICLSAGGLFSTHVSPAPMFWQAGGLQSQVAQAASPSTDTCGDGSPDKSPSIGSLPSKLPQTFLLLIWSPSCVLQPAGF